MLLRLFHACATAALVTSSALAQMVVTVDTSAFAGTQALLAFDLIDGGDPRNSVTLSHFSTTGQLGATSSVGSVTGSFPGVVTLTDASFFNELLTGIMLGGSFTFQLSSTTNPPAMQSFPDAFALYILERQGDLPLFPTSDPTHGGALLTVFLSGSLPEINVYSPILTIATIPEPSMIYLALSGILAVLLGTRQKLRQ